VFSACSWPPSAVKTSKNQVLIPTFIPQLLQSSARELRPLLVSIWAKILSVDPSCQTDLIRDSSHKYFLQVLQDECMMPNHRTWAAFILATIVHDFPQGQQEAEQGNLVSICIEHLDSRDPVLRQWLAIALGRVWDKFEKARWRGARDNAHVHLFDLLKVTFSVCLSVVFSVSI
jgi:regulator-associated protein of mTOR